MEATILLVLWEIIILGLLLPPQKIDIFQFTKRIIISTKPQWWSTLYINKIILNRIDLEKINTYALDKLNMYILWIEKQVCKLDQIFPDPKSQLLKNWPPSAFKNIFTIVSSQSMSCTYSSPQNDLNNFVKFLLEIFHIWNKIIAEIKDFLSTW